MCVFFCLLVFLFVFVVVVFNAEAKKKWDRNKFGRISMIVESARGYMDVRCNSSLYFYVCVNFFMIKFLKRCKGAPKPSIIFLSVLGKEHKSPRIAPHTPNIVPSPLELLFTLLLAQADRNGHRVNWLMGRRMGKR